MTDTRHSATKTEPLDEVGVDRATADEEADVALSPYGEGSDVVEPGEVSSMNEPSTDEPTPESLEEELEDSTAGPEVEAMHVEDEVTEVLDDERDVVGSDVGGGAGDELEWRIAASSDRDDIMIGGTAEASPAAQESESGFVQPADPVSAVMATPMARIEPEVSLIELATALEAEGVGALAVMGGDDLEGVVSERDVVRALARGGDPGEVRAADVMAPDPVSADVDDAILDVAERMLDEGVRHLPVISGGRVVGAVSVRDVLRVLTDAWRQERGGD